MNDSWIAVVDRHGLRQLILETDHALPFLIKRSSREDIECFWAVLEPRHVRAIEQLRRTGDSASALRWLDYLATDVGRIALDESAGLPQFPDNVTIPDNRDREWNY